MHFILERHFLYDLAVFEVELGRDLMRFQITVNFPQVLVDEYFIYGAEASPDGLQLLPHAIEDELV